MSTLIAGSGCSRPSGEPKSLVHWQQVLGSFVDVSGMAADRDGNVWIAEASANRVLRVDNHGHITTGAGAGQSSADGTATSTQLSDPHQLAVDGRGRLLIADTGNNRIEMIDPAGRSYTVAGPAWLVLAVTVAPLLGPH